MSKPKHRVTSALLTLCLILTLAAGVFLAAPVQVHAAAHLFYPNGDPTTTYTIYADKVVRSQGGATTTTNYSVGDKLIFTGAPGTSGGTSITVAAPNVTLTLLDYNSGVTSNLGAGLAANVNTTVVLEGSNILSAGDNSPAIAVASGHSVTITGSGSLKAHGYSAPAIGSTAGMGSVTIAGGSVTVDPADVAYDIGTGGNLTVNGGTLQYSTAGEYDGTPNYVSGTVLDMNGNIIFHADATPTPAPDAGTAEYYNRHYDFYYGVLGQLQQAADNATINVDATGQNLDMVMGFIFDELKDTNRTLIINSNDSRYVVSGGPEDKNTGTMYDIRLGNNYSFKHLLELGLGYDF